VQSESFRPSVHGFACANSFTYPGANLGLGAPLAADFGLAGGLCWAALDRYLAGRPVPAPTATGLTEAAGAGAGAAAGVGEELYLELVRRQANAVAAAGWPRVLEWQRLPDAGRRGAPGVAELTRRELARARRLLDGGTPVLLLLVRGAGAHENPSVNRFVLAYRHEADRRSRSATLWVYDPNQPGRDDLRLTLRTAPRRGPLEARLGVREQVRGFFVVPYDRGRPLRAALAVPASGAGRCAVADGSLPLSLADRRGRVQLFGRDAADHLLRVRCGRDGRWRAEPIRTAWKGESVCAPGTPAPAGALLLARSAAGDLLACRPLPLGRWHVRNVTGGRGIGSAYRLEDGPVACAGGGALHAVGRRGSHLVYYERRRWYGWRAENLSVRLGLAADHPCAGKPLVCHGAGGTVHVLARDTTGHLVHALRRRGRWTVANVSARTGGAARVRIAGEPVLARGAAGELAVVAVDAAGGIALFRWAPGAPWRHVQLGEGGAAQPAEPLAAAATKDGTIHVFSRGPEGTLVHDWCGTGGRAGREVVNVGRAAVGDLRIDGPPQLAVGPDCSLHVIARRGSGLLHFRWTAASDWEAEALSSERWPAGELDVASEPRLLAASDGAIHVVAAAEGGELRWLRLARPRQAPTWQAPLRRILTPIPALPTTPFPGPRASRGPRPATGGMPHHPALRRLAAAAATLHAGGAAALQAVTRAAAVASGAALALAGAGGAAGRRVAAAPRELAGSVQGAVSRRAELQRTRAAKQAEARAAERAAAEAAERAAAEAAERAAAEAAERAAADAAEAAERAARRAVRKAAERAAAEAAARAAAEAAERAAAEAAEAAERAAAEAAERAAAEAAERAAAEAAERAAAEAAERAAAEAAERAAAEAAERAAAEAAERAAVEAAEAAERAAAEAAERAAAEAAERAAAEAAELVAAQAFEEAEREAAELAAAQAAEREAAAAAERAVRTAEPAATPPPAPGPSAAPARDVLLLELERITAPAPQRTRLLQELEQIVALAPEAEPSPPPEACERVAAGTNRRRA
jgi:hypothetical protein